MASRIYLHVVRARKTSPEKYKNSLTVLKYKLVIAKLMYILLFQVKQTYFKPEISFTK